MSIATAGEWASFTIIARDSFGMPRPEAENFLVRVTGAVSAFWWPKTESEYAASGSNYETHFIPTTYLFDGGRLTAGRHSAAFRVTQSGSFLIDVKVPRPSPLSG